MSLLHKRNDYDEKIVLLASDLAILTEHFLFV